MSLREQLSDYIRGGIKSDRIKNIGLEAEHFIIKKDSGEAVPYAGGDGIGEVLSRLKKAIPESRALPGRDLLGLSTDDYIITLEPAVQLEISIAATEDIGRIESIYLKFLGILQSVLNTFGYRFVSVGAQPVSHVRSLTLIPKERYRFMDRYFETSGDGGIEMMRGTASAQVSIDYYSEEDFRDKLKAASFYMPLFKLLSENTPLYEGTRPDGHLIRTDIWSRTDKKRCGVLPGVFKPDYGFDDYADYLINVPLIYKETPEGEEIYTGEMTAGEVYGERALRAEDIEHIFSMVFPDVRVKRYLEIRGADAMPARHTAAYTALIKGLMYSAEGVEYAKKRIIEEAVTEESIIQTERSLRIYGWRGEFFGEAVKTAVENILDIARRNLPDGERERLAAFDETVRNEGIGDELCVYARYGKNTKS